MASVIAYEVEKEMARNVIGHAFYGLLIDTVIWNRYQDTTGGELVGELPCVPFGSIDDDVIPIKRIKFI
ncbi:hypothetical protein ACLOJK_026941 [Asimina triloba]